MNPLVEEMKRRKAQAFRSKLAPVPVPVIGKRYHTSWSKNPYMSWTLIAINGPTCILASKDSQYETDLGSLRHSPKKAEIELRAQQRKLQLAKQLEIELLFTPKPVNHELV